MTRNEWSVIAKTLKGAYGSQGFMPDRESALVYFELLKDLPKEVVETNAIRHCQTQKFPPSVSDLRVMSADWSQGWGKVERLISKYGAWNEKKALEEMDEATREAVRRIGWENICLSDNLNVDRANFRMIYENIATEQKTTVSLTGEIKCLNAENLKMLNADS